MGSLRHEGYPLYWITKFYTIFLTMVNLL